MHATNFDLSAYFRRIGYTGSATANATTLQALMRRQLFSVPFENLDVQAGKIVSMVPENITNKLLRSRRGGYCYEVNGLFAMALAALGISYRFVAARPMFYPVRRPRTHMALVAEVEGRHWLCDLGFGSYGIRAPMDLDVLDTEVAQDSDTFRLSRDAFGNYLLQAKVEGEWANQYGFDLSPQEWIDFVPANYLNSTHPDAIFVQKLLVVLHQPDGRLILLGDMFKTVMNGRVEKRQLTEEELVQVLENRFGLPARST
ncbi:MULTISPECIES: arylamine N-acetyltransferase [unclassified Herbaspirillum]|uniref:arylamine N-acetyltransferase family protein n=1 Tax=unclassified Herbaspirillum TaxID=2624150 RepID=UPI000E2FE971|nr:MULTISPECIES: arylamine N-acetyltransferase [unclassified Herbaspirillum]RFB71163.1 arylamine N-acetyltransferase [Herbaspirillum sp. 3R-3a1]TFI08308.1 arylamine N-acetyltransferase [Herbaspirillum sp. 3R11]TFI14723.1 arylamine N-acetyltransferase [Herbaspirillum sp. 3R-11]TFI31885.1 arylamine N-acetyltransferase [Herbaspirillum sp. 3C11]TFI32032.1 arylamine N-acetyltransferase [Herbaspirillum sp. 3C11]